MNPHQQFAYQVFMRVMYFAAGFVLGSSLSGCGPATSSECETARLECRAEYQRTRPFSAYSLFRHCSHEYGQCVGGPDVSCSEACAGAHDQRRHCEPQCRMAGGNP